VLVRYIVSSGNKHISSALGMLKIQYAPGEISKAEYKKERFNLANRGKQRLDLSAIPRLDI
jgi:uncharacterized membrane protein